jgi:hypothetical protein
MFSALINFNTAFNFAIKFTQFTTLEELVLFLSWICTFKRHNFQYLLYFDFNFGQLFFRSFQTVGVLQAELPAEQ